VVGRPPAAAGDAAEQSARGYSATSDASSAGSRASLIRDERINARRAALNVRRTVPGRLDGHLPTHGSLDTSVAAITWAAADLTRSYT
jgi:hypothetical protein